jgi:hypothetical protein
LTRDWLTRAGAHLGSLLRKWAIRFASSDGRDIVRDTPCLRSSVWTRAPRDEPNFVTGDRITLPNGQLLTKK